MARFIDFKLLRQSLSAEAIVAHYGIRVASRNGAQLSVPSPFTEDKRPSMGINAGKRIWKCFSSKHGGNLLDLVCRLEGHDPQTSEGIRAGALAAIQIFGEDGAATGPTELAVAHSATIAGNEGAIMPVFDPADTVAEPEEISDEPNAALTFELKLSPNHRMLKERPYRAETYAKMGMGYASRGMMKNRICFPLRDPDGTLVGYAGRWADAELPSDQPRYLYPKGFNKRRVLWNYDRIRVWEPEHVVIVEGFWSVLRLEENNVPVVSTLGHDLFGPQINMLVADGVKHVTVIYDGDDPGRTGAEEACLALAKHLFVRSIVLEDGEKPDTMPRSVIDDLPHFS